MSRPYPNRQRYSVAAMAIGAAIVLVVAGWNATPIVSSAADSDTLRELDLTPPEMGDHFKMEFTHYKRQDPAKFIPRDSLLPPENAIRVVEIEDFGVPGKHHGTVTVSDALDNSVWYTHILSSNGLTTTINHRDGTSRTEQFPEFRFESNHLSLTETKNLLESEGFEKVSDLTINDVAVSQYSKTDPVIDQNALEDATSSHYISDLSLTETVTSIYIDDLYGTTVKWTYQGVDKYGTLWTIEDWNLISQSRNE